MKTLELFAGTKSFSKVAQKLGHETLTTDIQEDLKPDLLLDIMNIGNSSFIKDKDIIWASPPCTAFSVASIGRHWKGGKCAYIPKSQTALTGLKILNETIAIIKRAKPEYWFIENPRGVMRKVIDDIFKKHKIKDYRRVTISYCQYGDTRMKPTDIWTNCKEWNPKSICKNGDKCHIAAPRGSKTGTQGFKGAKERGVIPPQLFKEIFKVLK